MADVGEMRRSSAIAFLVAAGLVFEIIAAMCSSPQTAEINALKRSETLMKYVRLGVAFSALFIIIAAVIEPDKAKPIFAGGFMAGGIMAACYYHANVNGLRSPEEGTEQY
jgi:hypothetical protein